MSKISCTAPIASETADYLRGKLDGFNEGVEAAAKACNESDGWDMHPKDYYKLCINLKRGNS